MKPNSRKMRNRAPALATAILASSAGVSSALAGFTTINSPPPPELTVNQILNGIYSTDFTQSGNDYYSSSIVATRIDDTPDAGPVMQTATAQNITPKLSGSATVDSTDQLWTAQSVHTTAEARYAAYDQHFGYFPGATGGSYHELFVLGGTGFDVSGEADLLSTTAGGIWRWGRSGPNGGTVSSLMSDNTDHMDHMITFRLDPVTPPPGTVTPADAQLDPNVTTYLLFFEDKLASDSSDFDFNDLVVQIEATPLNTAPTPEPAAISMLAVGAMLGLRRRRA